MKVVLNTIAILLVTFGVCTAQGPVCPINGVPFGCPSKYFKEIKVISSDIRLFKYTDKDAGLFLFLSAPTGSFDIEAVGALVLKTFPNKTGQKIEWKVEQNPLVMEMKTKYKYDLNVVLGLSETKLLEVKAYNFTVKDKKIVIGYVTDQSDVPIVNRAVFKAGEGTSDNAAGCNAVATALNSITREFKEKDQGCFLTVSVPTIKPS